MRALSLRGGSKGADEAILLVEIASSLPQEGTVKGILISPDAGGVRASPAFGGLAMTSN